jgi:HAD superfamily hydrolase (TIGR01509 family)
MAMIEAVVFDMDGVLVDSEGIWWEVREEFARSLGRRWREEDQMATMGCSTVAWARVMVERLGLGELPGWDEAAVAHEIIGRMQARYRERLPARAGAAEAVRRAAAHWRIALASGSPRELGETVLGALGLRDVLRVAVYGDEVEQGKPAPDIYLRALAQLGVAPARAVGVEDSANGIRALAAAGMGIVAAPLPGYALPPEVGALAGARIESLSELDAAVVEQAAKFVS